MAIEHTILNILEKLQKEDLIHLPPSKDFKDYRSEDSTQGIPPHMCFRFTTDGIDKINSTYPKNAKKTIGKFRYRYFCLFELYTYDTHDENPHDGYTLDLTFPIPDSEDSLDKERKEAFGKIRKVFPERSWARSYSGASWHHFHIAEISTEELKKSPEGFDKALEKFVEEAAKKAVEMSDKLSALSI